VSEGTALGDAHDIAVSYQRRRDLATGTTLIDDATWRRQEKHEGRSGLSRVEEAYYRCRGP
jgi:hypothetical protein